MSGRTIILILLLAAALRLALLACAWNNLAGVTTPDSTEYTSLCVSLLDGKFERSNQPEIFRAPGYPLFLIVGVAGGWRAVLIFQLLIDMLLVYLTYLLAWSVFDRRAALWAAAFQATSAVAIASSMRLLSDGLFAMLLTLAVLLFVHYWKFSRRWSLLASAAVLAAGCYVRPTGLVFAAILAAALLVRAIRQGPTSRSAFLDLAMYAGIGILLLGPWVARNAVRADYRGFSSFASDSVYADAVPELLAHLPSEKTMDAEAGRQYMRDLDRADEIAHGPRTPGQAARFRQEYSARVIGEHPWLYARLHVKGVVGFFLPGATDVLEIAGLSHGQRGTSDVLRKQGPWAAAQYYFGGSSVSHQAAAVGLTILIVAITAVQYLGVIVFLVRRRWRDSRGENRGLRPISSAKSVSVPASPAFRPSLSFLLLAMIVIASLLSGPYGFPRYQTMIVPLLSIFAAAGRPWRVERGA
jgi:4-amino-4-deoxy-L-arabinose transferase-like glycosyltransferase